MFWTALSIFIIGIIIAQALEKHFKKLEELKKQALEANPEYRKKVAYEKAIQTRKYWYEKYKKETEEFTKQMNEALKNGDKDKADQMHKKEYHVYKKSEHEEQKIEKLTNQLAFGMPSQIFKYNFIIEKITSDKIRHMERYFDDDEAKKSVEKLKGLPISILQETPNEDPYYGAYLANMQAEDKASEIIATLLDTKYLRNNYSNYPFTSWSVEEESDPEAPINKIYGGGVNGLQGNFVFCKLISVEQVSI